MSTCVHSAPIETTTQRVEYVIGAGLLALMIAVLALASPTPVMAQEPLCIVGQYGADHVQPAVDPDV